MAGVPGVLEVALDTAAFFLLPAGLGTVGAAGRVFVPGGSRGTSFSLAWVELSPFLLPSARSRHV